MPEKATGRLKALLRWSEKYTKTDMIYLATVGLWSNSGVIIISVLALLLSIAFANLLPSDVYGTYQYLISLSAIIAALTLGGMNSAVAQSVARGNEGDLRASVRVQLIWDIIPALIGLGGAVYYFLLGNTILGFGMIMIALFTPLTNTFNTYGAFLTGKKEFRRTFISNCITYAAYYPAMFLVMFFVKDAVILVFVNLATNLAATAFLYFRTLKLYKPNDQTDPQTVPYGAHLSVMNAFGTIVTQIDSVLVFHVLGAVQLAVYSFASMLPERLGGFLNFLGPAALPKFANQSREQVRKNILSKIVRSLVAGAILALVYFLCAPLIFHLIFPKYLSAIPYTEVYALDIVMMATAAIMSNALLALRLQFEQYVTSFVNPLILITLQVPFLLLWGIMGILVAKIIADALNILLQLILLLRTPKEYETPQSL
jgi:O-antigen/teichoic acid export membrane protein